MGTTIGMRVLMCVCVGIAVEVAAVGVVFVATTQAVEGGVMLRRTAAAAAAVHRVAVAVVMSSGRIVAAARF